MNSRLVELEEFGVSFEDVKWPKCNELQFEGSGGIIESIFNKVNPDFYISFLCRRCSKICALHFEKGEFEKEK